MKLPELRMLAKHNNVTGTSHLNKPQMIAVLIEKNILPTDYKSVSYRHDTLGSIRKQPRRVDIIDRETGVVTSYPSMYKAAKAYGQSAGIIAYHNGNVWRDRYEIKVYER
jgi:hypothetical protein